MCVRGSRIGTEHQIEKFLQLTSLFNEKLDEEGYRKKIRAIYEKLGATFLYNLVYKIDAEPGPDRLFTIDQCNPWTGADGAEVDEGISVGENRKTFGLFKGGSQISSVSKTTKETLQMLKGGLTAAEIADALYKSEKTDKSRAAIESQVEHICLRLESLGAIKRKRR